MPNWNQNSATFRHEDPTQIERIVKGFTNQCLFGEFLPTPKELCESVEIGERYNERVAAQEAANLEKFGYASWYEWNIDHWGTKWDVGEEVDSGDRIDQNTVKLSFDTAWSPPVAFYEGMTDMGFDITAYYIEEGMGFVGKYTTEDGDESFNFDSGEDLEDIPDDIREFWDLDTICELREDWEDEDDYESEDTEGDSESESTHGNSSPKEKS
jgi:hypothetical protein